MAGRIQSYDIDASLALFATGGKAFLPDSTGGDILSLDLSSQGFLQPRGGATVPEMVRTPSGAYSQADSVRRGALLNAVRALWQAESVTVDAGLAATVAANWTAARAAILADAQARYPERGYT